MPARCPECKRVCQPESLRGQLEGGSIDRSIGGEGGGGPRRSYLKQRLLFAGIRAEVENLVHDDAQVEEAVKNHGQKRKLSGFRVKQDVTRRGARGYRQHWTSIGWRMADRSSQGLTMRAKVLLSRLEPKMASQAMVAPARPARIPCILFIPLVSADESARSR